MSTFLPYLASPVNEVPCTPNLQNNAMSVDDMDRVALLEQWFCSNFECCGFSITSFHALIEHFEEQHAMVVEPDGKKAYPAKTPVSTPPKTLNCTPLQPLRTQNGTWPLKYELSQASTSTSFGLPSDTTYFSDESGFGFFLDPETGLLRASEGVPADFEPQGYEASPPSSPSPSSPAFSSPSSPASSSFPFSAFPSSSPSTTASPSPRVTAPLMEIDYAFAVPANVLSQASSVGRKDRIVEKTLDDQGHEACVGGSSRSERGVGIEGRGKGKGKGKALLVSAAAKANKKREKSYKCPRPGCTKSYLNPNGLKYHVEKGTCTFETPSTSPARSPPPNMAQDPAPAPLHSTPQVAHCGTSTPSPAPGTLLASHYAPSTGYTYPAYPHQGMPASPAISSLPFYAAHSSC